MDFKQHIAIVPDYPKEGIVFKDITPLMNDGKAYKAATDAIVEYAKERDIDVVVYQKLVVSLSVAQFLMR